VSRAEPADLLVNCTSVGLDVSPPSGQDAPAEALPPVQRSAKDAAALNQLGLTFDQVGEYTYVVDMAYRAGSTALLDAARAQHVHAVDGLDVLVAQGARSFELWTDRAAPLDVMQRAARAPQRAA
jgi:shikimate dehydrogenase